MPQIGAVRGAHGDEAGRAAQVQRRKQQTQVAETAVRSEQVHRHEAAQTQAAATDETRRPAPKRAEPHKGRGVDVRA